MFVEWAECHLSLHFYFFKGLGLIIFKWNKKNVAVEEKIMYFKVS